MAAIKDLGKTASKFVTNAGTAGPSYSEGVTNPRRSWSAAAKAAEDSYKQGVTLAITRGAFGKGVTTAGDEKYRKGAVEKGSVRFGPGVAAAAGDYQAGFAPYHQIISALTLPPRRARRDPANIQRVTAVAAALGAAKEARSK